MTTRKYGIVTAENKTFHDGEPVFILRGTDRLSPDVIHDYAEGCLRSGCSPEHVSGVLAAWYSFVNWQIAHPDLVKNPD